jgi:hypothetical protein
LAFDPLSQRGFFIRSPRSLHKGEEKAWDGRQSSTLRVERLDAKTGAQSAPFSCGHDAISARVPASAGDNRRRFVLFVDEVAVLARATASAAQLGQFTIPGSAL